MESLVINGELQTNLKHKCERKNYKDNKRKDRIDAYLGRGTIKTKPSKKSLGGKNQCA